MIVGVVVALLLALLDVVRLGPHGVGYRRGETWVSYSHVFVTQQGFPWGRLGFSGGASNPVADPSRLVGLASVYSALVTSDAVRATMAPLHPPVGTLQAATLLDPSNTQSALPIVSIAAFSGTKQHAMRLARVATRALIGYVDTQQAASGIPARDRVELQVVMHADHAALFKGRSLAMPILVFVAVLLAAVGLAFGLENLGRSSLAEPSDVQRRVRSAA